MSAKNRTDLKALITAWAATLDLEVTHKPTEQDILDSVLLNLDVINTIAASTGTTSVNFASHDTIVVNASASTAITLSGIAEGNIKYLVINKSAGNVITFTNADDQSFNATYCNTLTFNIFKLIYKKDTDIIAVPLHKTFDFSAIPAAETPGEWQQASLSSPWTEYTLISGQKTGVWYRLNRGYIDITCSVGRTLAGNTHICTLPAGYRPASTYPIVPFYFGGTGVSLVVLQSNGSLDITAYSTAPNNVFFTVSIPLT